MLSAMCHQEHQGDCDNNNDGIEEGVRLIMRLQQIGWRMMGKDERFLQFLCKNFKKAVDFEATKTDNGDFNRRHGKIALGEDSDELKHYSIRSKSEI